MTADEFLRQHAPPPERMRSSHDNINDHEAARLVAKFGPSTSEPLSDPALANVAKAGGPISSIRTPHESREGVPVGGCVSQGGTTGNSRPPPGEEPSSVALTCHPLVVDGLQVVPG